MAAFLIIKVLVSQRFPHKSRPVYSKKDTAVLTFATSAGYPLFEYLVKGDIQGFDMALLHKSINLKYL